MRIVPYNGNRAYKYYLDGCKVNGKGKRLFFKDEAAANRKLTELAKRQKKEGQEGLDISLESRVNLDRALVEAAEEIEFEWPEFLPMERIKAGIAEIALVILAIGILVFAAVIAPLWHR